MIIIRGKKYVGVNDEKCDNRYDESFELEDVESIEDKVLKYLASGQAVEDQRHAMYFGVEDDVPEDLADDEENLEYEPDYIELWTQRVAQKRKMYESQKDLLNKKSRVFSTSNSQPQSGQSGQSKTSDVASELTSSSKRSVEGEVNEDASSDVVV